MSTCEPEGGIQQELAQSVGKGGATGTGTGAGAGDMLGPGAVAGGAHHTGDTAGGRSSIGDSTTTTGHHTGGEFALCAFFVRIAENVELTYVGNACACDLAFGHR